MSAQNDKILLPNVTKILKCVIYIYIYRSVFQMEQPHGRRCYSLTKGELDSSPAPNKGAKGKRIYID